MVSVLRFRLSYRQLVELWVVKKAWIRERPDVSENPSLDWKYYPGERNRTDSGFLDEDNSRHA